jgi:hypothetical protein
MRSWSCSSSPAAGTPSLSGEWSESCWPAVCRQPYIGMKAGGIVSAGSG